MPEKQHRAMTTERLAEIIYWVNEILMNPANCFDRVYWNRINTLTDQEIERLRDEFENADVDFIDSLRLKH